MKQGLHRLLSLATLFLLVPYAASLQAQALGPWNLPSPIDGRTTEITFAVDTTWHTVHGTTADVTGRAWLENPKDFNSVRVEATLPVAKFDTDNSSRDKELRHVMAEDKFPAVTVSIIGMEGLAPPSEVDQGKIVKGTATAKLTIRDSTQTVKLPFELKREGNHYHVSGIYTFPWASFGVEDASIFIARVHELVSVHYSINLFENGATPLSKDKQ
jgi:polyisoprenoid-binding protein YceI